MADGQLESIWSQLHYAKRTLSPVRLVLKVTLILLLHCTGLFLCFWGVLSRLDQALHLVIWEEGAWAWEIELQEPCGFSSNPRNI